MNGSNLLNTILMDVVEYSRNKILTSASLHLEDS